jgi:alcohol dehydrogenase YqhD (iron-dependent ADH family)
MVADMPDPLPIGVVVTIAAAGSESSNSCVLTNQALGVKRGLRSEAVRPKFAIMDPTLTYTTPLEHTVAGIVDIYMHVIDRYFAPDTDNDVTDGIAESLMRGVIKHGKTIIDKPDDYKARSEIFWASALAHNGLAGLGQTFDFSIHALGVPFSAKYDTTHGFTLSATWPAWAEYVYKHDVARFAQYARNVWDIKESDDETAAKAGIKATVDFFRSVGSPVTIIEAVGKDVTDDIDELIDLCTYKNTRPVGAFKSLDNEDIRKIFIAAM